MISAIKNLIKDEANQTLELLVEKVATEQKEQLMKYKGKTIHKNKKCNSWYTRFRYAGNQFYISGKTQLECLQKLKRALRQISNDVVEEYKPITLIMWYKKWLELYKIGKVKEQTLRDYRSLLIHIQDEFKNKDIKEFKVNDIIQILDNCSAERQKQKLYEFLNAIFKKAKDNDFVNKNVVELVDKPKHDKNHGIALTNQQQEELVSNCIDITNIDVILVALYQGLRRGEVLGLTIDNIDFNNNTLTIDKAWSELNKFDTTKNKQSIRTMPLFDNTRNILLKYRYQKERIFDITNQACTKMLKDVRKRINIPNLHIKDMRSTFITRCKEFNIPKHVIQAWVGHVIGSTVTDFVYTKHNKDIDSNYINIINNSKLITKNE